MLKKIYIKNGIIFVSKKYNMKINYNIINNYHNNKNINDLIIIFIVSFIVNFIGKICIYEKDTNIPSIVGSNMKEVNNVCPF